MTERIRAITSTHGFGVMASAFGKQYQPKDEQRREHSRQPTYGQQVIEDQVETSQSDGATDPAGNGPPKPAAYGPNAYSVLVLPPLENTDAPELWSPLPMPPTTMDMTSATSAAP